MKADDLCQRCHVTELNDAKQEQLIASERSLTEMKS